MKSGLYGVCALGVWCFGVSAAAAQQAPASQGETPKAAAPASKPAKAAPAQEAGDMGLKARVEQLEEQLVDLQVVIGTLESLAKAPPAAAAPSRPAYAASPTGADAGRVEVLETQIRALTQQLEQLAAEVRAGRGGNVFAQPPANGAAVPQGGAVTVSPAPAPPDTYSADPIGGIISEQEPTAGPAPDVPSQVAAVTPHGEDPKLAYEAAYGHMLQQNYSAAQTGFADFLKRNPGHALVPNALYWLGETYYVQRNYADAAEAFDIVLAAHSASNKAPDSQLKKAMSLSQLGKNADACAALKQLSAKYPNAPQHVKTKADSERRRVGCS